MKLFLNPNMQNLKKTTGNSKEDFIKKEEGGKVDIYRKTKKD